jgi:alpha/beta superfamily hydrolase
MHDGVLDVVAKTLLDAGISCLRFNFRGTGASTGSHSGGPGERLDLVAAVEWVRAELAPAALWLGGYSFGASVVWDYLVGDGAPTSGIARAILVAPPTGAMAFASGHPSCPVDAIAGSADHFVDRDALAALPGVTAHVLTGADHFFSSDGRALASTLARLISP